MKVHCFILAMKWSMFGCQLIVAAVLVVGSIDVVVSSFVVLCSLVFDFPLVVEWYCPTVGLGKGSNCR